MGARTIEDMEKLVGKKYEDCSFIMRMAMVASCLNEEKESAHREA